MCCTPMLPIKVSITKRSKMPLSEMVTLTVCVNEVSTFENFIHVKKKEREVHYIN